MPGLKINSTLLLQIHDNYALAWQNISSKFWWLKINQNFPESPVVHWLHITVRCYIAIRSSQSVSTLEFEKNI